MSLREEMRKMVGNDKLREESECGKFSRWWYFDEVSRNSSGRSSPTFIGFMLNEVTSDEELELLWAQWNIERED